MKIYLSDTFVEYFRNYKNYCTKAPQKMVVIIKMLYDCTKALMEMCLRAWVV